MSVDFDQYWDRLVDYYYEHVHYYQVPMVPKVGNQVGIHRWLHETYGARAVFRPKRKLCFDSPEQYSLFVLRWS